MEIKISGKDLARAETINVSANGVYFVTPSYMQPLTKLQITLVLPADSGADPREVLCEGVVVRVDPEEPRASFGKYEIACYFTSIAAADREFLESYILKQLTF